MNYQQKTGSLYTLLICFFTLGFLGCNLNPNENPDNEIMADNLELLPSKFWISDAQNFANLDVKTTTAYTLYSSFLEDNREVEMHFDSGRNLFLIRLIQDGTYQDNLYCEAGRIVFSEHDSPVSGIEWMVAYANGKAYATAEKREGEWISRSIKDAPIQFDVINAAVLKAAAYQKKELTKTYYQRITENKMEISGSFNTETSLSFLLNVRKDAAVNIDLVNNPSSIYFMVHPNNSADMEHQNWDYTAEKSGDISITVFSAPSSANQTFTIKTKVITPQNQGYARAH